MSTGKKKHNNIQINALTIQTESGDTVLSIQKLASSGAVTTKKTASAEAAKAKAVSEKPDNRVGIRKNHFMSLVGTYSSTNINATLVISSADDSNGQASGTITVGPTTVPVSIYYHFQSNIGPATNLALVGSHSDPNFFIGGAGLTNYPGYPMIQMALGYSTVHNTVEGLQVTFYRAN